MKLKKPKVNILEPWMVKKQDLSKYGYQVMKGEEKKEESLTEFNFVFKVWKGRSQMGGTV